MSPLAARTVGLLGAAGQSAATYQSEVLADSPISYWRLNENSGATAADYQSVADIDFFATVDDSSQAPAWSQSGPDDVSALLDGEYGLTAPSYTAPGAVSIEVWVKTSTTPTRYARVWGFTTAHDSGTYDKQIEITSSGFARFYTFFGSQRFVTGTTDITDGNWHHVVGVVTGSSGATMRLYVDGVEEGTALTSVGHTTGYTHKLLLGGRVDGGNPGESDYIGATLGEPAYYNTALSASRIEAHYDAATGA